MGFGKGFAAGALAAVAGLIAAGAIKEHIDKKNDKGCTPTDDLRDPWKKDEGKDDRK